MYKYVFYTIQNITKTSERWNGCKVGQSGINSANESRLDPQPYNNTHEYIYV